MRRGPTRAGGEGEREQRRIPEQYEEGRHHPAFGQVIDRTRLTAEEAAREILAFL